LSIRLHESLFARGSNILDLGLESEMSITN
jgi:hypothetical protein